jgi:hypothetical protein
MWVNTRARSTPPVRRTNDAAATRCKASARSPAIRSATHDSTVVDRSPGPPAYVDHEPSSFWCERRWRAVCSSPSGVATPRK